MAKQQNPIVSDDADEIIDLTEIVQKGKAPLASKPDVDFDSALSDLMGKAPAMKLNETPELEALLSGIEEDAPKRRPTFKEDEEEGPVELRQAVPGADDMDSLLTTLEGKKGKATQPAEDVDSLLDSLMDDLGPAGSGEDKTNQEISDDDLDDLLSSIDQDSKQGAPKAAEPDTPAGLDDLLAGLEMPKAPKKEEMKTPDDLDDLLAGLNAPAPKAAAKAEPKAEAKPAKQEAPEPPSDLDDLLAGLNVAKPAKRDTQKAQDDLDKLLAGMDFSSPTADAAEVADAEAETPEAKPAPKPVDSIDDLLAGLDNLTKPKPAEAKTAKKADAPMAPSDLDDLLAGLDGLKSGDKEEAEAPAKAEVRGIPDGDLDDLLAGLEAAVTPAKKAAPAADDKVDFGDLASLLDTPAPAASAPADSMDEPDSTADSLADFMKASETEDADVAENVAENAAEEAVEDTADDAPDGPVDFSKPSFDAKDFDDLDALFSEKTPATLSSKAAPALSSKAAKPAPMSTRLADLPPAAPLPPLPPDPLRAAAPSAALSELTARVERVESELSALQERVATLETRPAPEPQQEQLAAMLVDGTPLCNRLMELMRSAIAQELKSLSAEAEASTQAIATLENRAVSMEGKLAEVAIMAAKAMAGPETPESGLSAADLAPLTDRLDKLEVSAARLDTLEASAARLDKLEASAVRQEELDVLSERLDGLEESSAKAGEASEPAATPAETTATPGAVSPEELAKLEQRLAVLEARPYVPLETIQGAFDQMGEQLNVPLQQFQNRITALEQRLADEALPRLAGDLVPFMSESIDKAAAASAAQALREELEAMMSEDAEDAEDADDVEAVEDDSVEDDSVDDVDMADNRTAEPAASEQSKEPADGTAPADEDATVEK